VVGTLARFINWLAATCLAETSGALLSPEPGRSHASAKPGGINSREATTTASSHRQANDKGKKKSNRSAPTEKKTAGQHTRLRNKYKP